MLCKLLHVCDVCFDVHCASCLRFAVCLVLSPFSVLCVAFSNFDNPRARVAMFGVRSGVGQLGAYVPSLRRRRALAFCLRVWRLARIRCWPIGGVCTAIPIQIRVMIRAISGDDWCLQAFCSCSFPAYVRSRSAVFMWLRQTNFENKFFRWLGDQPTPYSLLSFFLKDLKFLKVEKGVH